MNANNKWFTFRQNNSGGRFVIDNEVDTYVIIQAGCADEANSFAEKIGIYFDGVRKNKDCECCGDRWCRAYGDDDGTDEPMIYDEAVTCSPDVVSTVNWDDTWGTPTSIKVYPYNSI